MQRATTVSNNLRNRSLSPKRPWRFLERSNDRDVGVEPQATETTIGQIGVELLAQPPLRANAVAVNDDEHPDHQLGIDRWPPIIRYAMLRDGTEFASA
jgi:hypothetical protein